LEEVYPQERESSRLNGRPTVKLTPKESQYLRRIKRIDLAEIPNKVIGRPEEMPKSNFVKR
jgi:hypothetical protein